MRRAGHRVIPNGVDCDLFHPDEAAGRAFGAATTLGDGPVLLGVGALEIEKPGDCCSPAWALLAPPAPPLVLCGTGALERSLQAHKRAARTGRAVLGQMDSGQLSAPTMRLHVRGAHAPRECSRSRLIEALHAGGRWSRGRRRHARARRATPASGAAATIPPRFAAGCWDLLDDAGRRAALGLAGRRQAGGSATRWSDGSRPTADVLEESQVGGDGYEGLARCMMPLLALLYLTPAPAQQPTLAIVGGRIIDGFTGARRSRTG